MTSSVVELSSRYRQEVTATGHKFSNPPYVRVEKKRVTGGDDERRGQTKGRGQMKYDSSNSIFDRARGVERNIGHVGTKVSLECKEI